MTDSAYQSLGAAVELLPVGQTLFVYDEFVTLTGLLGNGSSTRNYVAQESGPMVRKAAVTWEAVDPEDLDALQTYAEDKSEQIFTEEDGTSRPVILLDFKPVRGAGDEWTVSATLVETADPTPPGS